MLRAREQEEMEPYFSGKKLYGNDFTEEQIRQWFRDEELGYYNPGSHSEGGTHEYGYHALNRRHGFRILPDRTGQVREA